MFCARKWLLAASGVAAMMAAPAVMAEDAFPSKPIQFVVPYPPGGPLDSMARLLAERVKGDLGTVVVENKSGAGGNIGASIVAKAAPDGYTLMMGAVAINAINPWLYKTVPFDPVQSFEPIALVASVPNILIVNKEFAQDNKIATVQDLVAYAKQHPGQLNFASGGNGSAGHLAGAVLNTRAQIDAIHVPYAGAAPAKTALLAGQVHFMFDNLASAAPLIKADSVKALAVTTTERSNFFPDVPTMEQAGVQPFDLGTWFGVFVTGGTPQPIVQKLHDAYAKALTEPSVRQALAVMGSDAEPGTVEQFRELVSNDLKKYKEVVASSGAELF
ncbi:Bug family tripartite tricarboxylate transporter substrate binding protein [Alcaligenes sp. WGS1538]|uniref:Bug family tripartite tricarboxylate transporter substrate binding protein n=1 Tax=Alcaligenes sp. WGS1538 TaxID=3366811 RepID=UPI00372D03B9